jgi:hypothetical protein
MNWLNTVSPALQAIAAIASFFVTALLAWLTWQSVKLATRMAEVSSAQTALISEQLQHSVKTALDLHQRKAAALQELSRRFRVTTRHLEASRPTGPMSKGFSYITEGDIAVFDSLAHEVSVQAAKTAALLTIALRTVFDHTSKTRTDSNWVPTQQEKVDWEGALETLANDLPKLEQDCTDVLLKKA